MYMGIVWHVSFMVNHGVSVEVMLSRCKSCRHVTILLTVVDMYPLCDSCRHMTSVTVENM